MIKLKKLAGQVSKILFIIVLLSLAGCKDDKNNNILVPDFIEFWGKKEIQETPVVVVEIKTAPKPETEIKKAIAANPAPKIEQGEIVDKKLKGLDVQDRIIKVAEKYLHVREDKGNNRSKDIDIFNSFANVDPGSFWCASYVNWVYAQSGVTNRPKSPAWSPSWFSKNLVDFKDLDKGMTVGYYNNSPDLKRISHIGIYTGEKQGVYYKVIEGNTSPEDGRIERDGKGNTGGVYKKLRNAKLLSDPRNKFSKWY